MTIKRVLYNFMECSSLNALPFIINAENGFIKFFWIFTFLAGKLSPDHLKKYNCFYSLVFS